MKLDKVEKAKEVDKALFDFDEDINDLGRVEDRYPSFPIKGMKQDTPKFSKNKIKQVQRPLLPQNVLEDIERMKKEHKGNKTGNFSLNALPKPAPAMMNKQIQNLSPNTQVRIDLKQIDVKQIDAKPCRNEAQAKVTSYLPTPLLSGVDEKKSRQSPEVENFVDHFTRKRPMKNVKTQINSGRSDHRPQHQ